MIRIIAVVVCLFGFAPTLPADQASGGDGSSVTEGSLIYKTVDGRDLRIDFTRPADWTAEDQRSAVVFIHGGGWTGGKPGQFSQHSLELADRGVVCFRVEYRLLDKKSKLPPITCTEDVSDAFRYIRGHASELGIDPNRIAAGGGSAGGHLASFLGMMDDVAVDGVSRKPNALLLFNPVYDNRPGQWGDARVGDRVKEFSPSENITKDDPPAIVFLGTEDKLIPVATAKRFRDKMTDAGLRSELYLYEGEGHGFFNAGKGDNSAYRSTTDRSIGFLKSLGWFDN
ncbi:alpha/beta hydrolase [Crateriforma spongiae]|uniref:alpha/beta hydrolase n=1 Tax=Crateriforma spongiae TaxID=2724528 RepID=UPI0039AFF296